MQKHSRSIKYSSSLLELCECTEIEILNVNYILIHVQRYIRMHSVKAIIIDKCKQNIKIFHHKNYFVYKSRKLLFFKAFILYIS